jgi:predicted xylose isomerase-like sugar epimerase
MPLRARGLVSLIGKTICAVVYDSDISINYTGKHPFTNANLQGETLGIVAFQVNEVRKLNGFSSSTLPEVQLTIRSASTCGTWTLFNAPVPRSSSVPNDIDPANLAGTGNNGYRQLLTYPEQPLFF